MYDEAKAIARLKNANPPIYLWAWGDSPLDPACVNRTKPETTHGCKPLAAITAHLHPTEWETYDTTGS